MSVINEYILQVFRCMGITHVFKKAILDEFAKLRKAIISFVMSVCLTVSPSVHPRETARISMKFYI